jgi:hypothetical protein
VLDEVALVVSATAASAVGGVLGAVYLRCFVRVPPNRAFVLYGRKAPRFPPDQGLGSAEVAVHRPRIVVGGRVYLPPWNKGVEQLSLDPVSVDVGIRTLGAGPDGRASGWEIHLRLQAKIPAEPSALSAAAENLLHRTVDEVKASIRRSVEGVVPSVLSRWKSDDEVPDWDRLAAEIQAAVASELVIWGLVVQSLSVTELRPILPNSASGGTDRGSRTAPVRPAPVPATEPLGVGPLEARLSRSEGNLKTLGAAVARLYRAVTGGDASVSGGSALDAPLGAEVPEAVVFPDDSGLPAHDSTVGISPPPARVGSTEGNGAAASGRDVPLE